MSEEKRLAVLIDAENISYKYIKILFDEASNYGITTFRRIYGDWTCPRNAGWKDVLLDYSITPIQQYSYTEGKNASDSALIIDAMDILYTERVDGFILVSSDSDFTRLASRLRESGMLVLGMGESKTPSPFIAACNSFKYLDILYESSEEEKKDPKKIFKNGSNNKKTYKQDPRLQPRTKLSTIRRALKMIINENSDEDSFMSLANLGNQLSKRYPDFDVRNYGHKKFVTFVESLGDFYIDPRSVSADGKTKQFFIRMK